MPTIVLHVQNDDPVMGEVDNLPVSTDSLIIVKNPRRKDGKDLYYLDANVTTAMWPVARVNFIEIMPTAEEEQIIGFVRE